MLDSIALIHRYNDPLPPDVLAGFFFKGNGRYVLNPSAIKGYSQPSITISSVNDIHYITARVSLPKMLFANNIRAVTDGDMSRALDEISFKVSAKTSFCFDASSANVTRFDVCANFTMSMQEVSARLKALQIASMPYMTRHIIDDETVDFRMKSQRVSIYDKNAETRMLARRGKATNEDIKASVGMLRLERRYLTTRAVNKVVSDLRLPTRQASDILREEIAGQLLSETMSELGMDKEIESTDSRIELLRERYKFTSLFYKLRGFLQSIDDYGETALKNAMNPKTYRKHREAVKAAGAWMTNPMRKTLPPLRLVKSEDHAAKRLHA